MRASIFLLLTSVVPSFIASASASASAVPRLMIYNWGALSSLRLVMNEITRQLIRAILRDAQKQRLNKYDNMKV